jgi:Nucleotidyl transferase AbiEii toxin, Type IV TA system
MLVVSHTFTSAEAGETKLLVRRGAVEVKIEVNFVTCGTIHPVRAAPFTPKASEVLLADLEVPLVSLEDLYGGKLATKMDRQLFEHEGITPGFRQAFVVYLASHNRPVHEVLFPTMRDIAQEYDGTFRGITAEPVALEDLLKAREQMMTELQRGLNSAERKVSCLADPERTGMEPTQHSAFGRTSRHSLEVAKPRSVGKGQSPKV